MRRRLCLVLTTILLSSQAPVFADAGKPPASISRGVAITGGVERPAMFGVDQLRQRPIQQIVSLQLTDKTTGNTSTVRGIRLRDLLDEAKIVTRDHNTVKKLAIIVGAADGYKVVFSWSELFNSPLGDSVLVLFERDGKPLPENEGPMALVSGQDIKTGPRHVKWLQAIEVRQIAD